MTANKNTRDYYGSLVGKTVKEVQFVEDVGRGEDFPVLVFTDGTTASVERDSEGNGAGFLEIVKAVVCDVCRSGIMPNEDYYEVKQREVGGMRVRKSVRCARCCNKQRKEKAS